MCLSTINKEYESYKSDKVRTGWKLFKLSRQKELLGVCRTIKGNFVNSSSTKVKRNVWLKSTNGRINADTKHNGFQWITHQYEVGFHIFPTRADARKWNRRGGVKRYYLLYKVLYNDVTTEGVDKGSKVVIAKKMKILEQSW